MKAYSAELGDVIETDIPSRLDRLPWSKWHWRVVIALGITWILDGLEVTIVGSLAAVLKDPQTLHFSDTQTGITASAYILGAVLGALVFGRLTDALGRKKLFLVSLSVYLGATLLTACSWNFWSFVLFRAITGAGIGGEYSAINSAIDELIPARVRGRVDIAINSTFWLGALLGSASTLVLLDPALIPKTIGWRLCFLMGAFLGFAILLIRRNLPESPRWLIAHGRLPEAEKVVRQIESSVQSEKPFAPLKKPNRVRLTVKGNTGFVSIAKVLFKSHRRRAFLGLTLMISQAFAYNAIFFTYALVLSRYYGVPSDRVGLYLIPFAAGNLIGPLILGPLFDSIGRRIMIASTYLLAGVLLLATGYGFAHGWLSAASQTALWCLVFFMASAAASSAYLTVSELFPVEMRGLAIALFYSVGTGVGGLAAPTIFGALIQTGNREDVFAGYAFGALLMIAAGIVAAIFGEAAEGKSLEQLSGDLLLPD